MVAEFIGRQQYAFAQARMRQIEIFRDQAHTEQGVAYTFDRLAATVILRNASGASFWPNRPVPAPSEAGGAPSRWKPA